VVAVISETFFFTCLLYLYDLHDSLQVFAILLAASLRSCTITQEHVRVSMLGRAASVPGKQQRRKLVIQTVRLVTKILSMIGVALALTVFTLPACSAQEKHVSQTSGVDNTKMGPYRALAQLALAASQKGDNVTAAELARVLERTWDKAEDYGGDTALSKTNHALFEQIDKAMDQFITLLTEHATSAPDSSKVKAAYSGYMEKLKLAD
jgi:hypothetical protein